MTTRATKFIRVIIHRPYSKTIVSVVFDDTAERVLAKASLRPDRWYLLKPDMEAPEDYSPSALIFRDIEDGHRLSDVGK